MPRDLLARRLLWALAGLCLVSFAALAPHLLYSDLNLDYPFVDGDSHDWIANGLHLSGHQVRYSGRPPLLPLALAALDRAGLLRWWPLVGLLFFLGTVVGFYTLAARLFPPAAAFVGALLLLADYSLLGLAFEVMADLPASCLILWSARAFFAASGDPPRRPSYAASGLLAGLSALTQPAALLLPLAAGATLVARRRRDLRTCWPWIGALLAAGCPIAWMAVRRFGMASYGDSLLDPWALLGFHMSSVRFYLWSLISLVGLPACLLLVAGIVLAIRSAWRGAESQPDAAPAASLFALLLFAVLVGFFVFFYRYDAKRFLVYAVWPGAILVCQALARLASCVRPAGRAGFVGVAVLAVGAAALPLPGPPHDSSWAALWPVPPLAAYLPVAGGPSGGGGALAAGAPRTPTVAMLDPAMVPRWSAFGRAARAWSERPRHQRLPGYALFAGADSALYLFDRLEDGGGRYRTITRLSNAIGKPVRFIPRSSLAPYWPLLAVDLVARLTPDYTIYRAALPGQAGTWLLVTPGDRPLDPGLLRTGRGGVGPGRDRPWRAGQPARALAEAAAIREYVGHGNAYVVLVPSPYAPRAANLAQLYLLFLLETSELYVVEPPDVASAFALLARSPQEGERHFGAARVARRRILGRRTALISFLP